MTTTRLAPRANPALFALEPLAASLAEGWAQDRLHHAWLITGPAGIGKATLAFRFARFLLSNPAKPGAGLFGGPPDPPDLALDPDHPVFRRVAAGSHPDLLVIERLMDEKRGRQKSAVGVDQIRQVADFMHLTPAEGGWRIVIIDPVDDLNVNASNALLKVLEEPPPRALLLLTSHAPGGLLPTIRSRCRLLRAAALPDAMVERILLEQGAEIDPGDRTGLIRLAEGSAGRAFDLLEQGGLSFFRDMLAILTRPAPANLAAQHALADKLSKAGAEAAFETFFRLWEWWLRRTIDRVARGGTGPEILPGEAELMQRLAAGLGLAGLLDVWEKSRLSFARAEGLALDKKQVILSTFALVSR